jgi:hypothetical protein
MIRINATKLTGESTPCKENVNADNLLERVRDHQKFRHILRLISGGLRFIL